MESKQLISCGGKVDAKTSVRDDLTACTSKNPFHQADKDGATARREARLSLPHHFSRDCRATSATADRNKENIPSGSRTSTGQDGSMEAQECQGGQSEDTPRPRKWKQSPSLVRLTGNQDAHTVSHHSLSHLLSSS